MPNPNGYLLPLMALVLVVFSAISQSFTSRPTDDEVSDPLQELAKQLIDFAHTYPEQDAQRFKGLYGFLPSPSRVNRSRDGAGLSGSVRHWVVGQLPWYSLGIPQPFSVQGECYVYVVSGPAQKHTAYVNTLYNPDFPQPLHYRGQQGVAAIFPLEAIPEYRTSGSPKDWNVLCRNLDLRTLLNPPSEATLPWDISPIHPLYLITTDAVFDRIHQRKDFQRSVALFAQAYLRCLYTHATQTHPPEYTILPANLNLTDLSRLSAYQAQTSVSSQTVYLGRLPILTAHGEDIGTPCTALNVDDHIVDLSRKRALTHHSEQRKLWTHWKDHWFYAIAPTCLSNDQCIQHDHQQYIAAVIFANQAQVGQDRSRSTFNQWLENPWLTFPPSPIPSTITVNDLAWCLNKTNEILPCNS